MRHSLPAVILDEAAQLIGLLGAEQGVELVVGVEGVVVPVRAFFNAAVGAAGNTHGNSNHRLGAGKIGFGGHQIGGALKTLNVADGNAVNAKLGSFLFDHLRGQLHIASPHFCARVNTPPCTS